MNSNRTDPKLPLPPETPCFRVPDGYFDQLTRSIMDGVSALPASEEKARPLPFRTPDGYFEILTGQILSSVDKPASVLPFKRKVVHSAWWWSAAAMIFFGALLFKGTFQSTVIGPATSESITMEEIQQSYLMDDLDESLLADAINSETDNQTEESALIQDYLIDNGTDFSQIDIEL